MDLEVRASQRPLSASPPQVPTPGEYRLKIVLNALLNYDGALSIRTDPLHSCPQRSKHPLENRNLATTARISLPERGDKELPVCNLLNAHHAHPVIITPVIPFIWLGFILGPAICYLGDDLDLVAHTLSLWN